MEDAAWYVQSRDEEVFKWTCERRDLTVEEKEQAIESGNRELEVLGFAIINRKKKEKMGRICLACRERNGDCEEVMYRLAACGRGRGKANSSVLLLCRWAFDLSGLEGVTLKTRVGNIRSQSVAKHVGQKNSRC